MLNRLLFFLGLAILAGAFYACGPSKKDQQAALRGEVMAIHDEVMPLMDEIHTLKKALSVQVEGLLADTLHTQPGSTEGLQVAIANLEHADEAMMQWMREFEPMPGERDHDAFMQYLQEQKAAIAEVRDEMNNAIEQAKALVK